MDYMQDSIFKICFILHSNKYATKANVWHMVESRIKYLSNNVQKNKQLKLFDIEAGIEKY